MINYDSILSAFDGKPTLLQWLKLVKKALDESILKDITLRQDGANAIFTFNFEDGTSISTPAVTLPKGDTGAKGDKGEQGVSVTGVDEVSNEVVGAQTLTTLRFNFSNGTNNEVVVHAENGKNASGGGKLYLHEVSTFAPTTETAFIINALSKKSSQYLNFDEMYNDNFFPGQVKVESQGATHNAGYFTKATVGNTKVFRFDTETESITTNAETATVLTDTVTEL